jgi:hypothetical protein
MRAFARCNEKGVPSGAPFLMPCENHLQKSIEAILQ